VLTGPHWQNFKDSYEALLRHRGAIEVRSADDIAVAVARLLQNPGELQRMTAGANSALEVLGGALELTVSALQPLLPKPTGMLRAS
jgi:3-deoxy-D-manno-octulosonic-acid transferase